MHAGSDFFTTKIMRIIEAGGTIAAKKYRNPHKPPRIVTTLKGEANPVFKTAAKNGFAKWISSRRLGDEPGGERFNKDSKEFLVPDLRDLADYMLADDEHEIFIMTHGTDDIDVNSAILDNYLAGSGKTVVAVTAMVPISMHNQTFIDDNGKEKLIDSDGFEALEHALNNAHFLHARYPAGGVHITAIDIRNSKRRFFRPHEIIRKNRAVSLANLALTVESVVETPQVG